ncbi:LLM class flavin-dependent oxidoreductase [Streptomyces cocklensis]|jgi:alkanesulfonate monooxygenase SsuD/methylene tetrahydromethanopterin reductase-like flavin-dependent oxidoreductase (luciferase family)|uniref:LLM class flavin-dependent oxidoreductase n=1 Tax=Actinacidiphila cocklensis TaxID=887465 RepID=A0A9W4GWK5_9ACTN|nr:LLM class flavin-dependent oxidoreductase [Actinacidiphila cocklensis]MDD1063358.1 LLM class flavin-dependent oxidoreductase [Actinacidiphila cocklensis]CAG6399073.1 LLM class flavin-dependent oxidoreductase [Actinacidiphila cocklensis]
MTRPDPGGRRLHLALETDGDGAHPAAGQARSRAAGGAAALRGTVGDAEAGGFTLVTFADGPLPPRGGGWRPEAGTRAALVSTLTDRIGLAPTLHATVTEPFHLATQLASLDHASNGRAAWVVGAANGADAHATVGASPLDADALHREITDVVDTARALWDSWEDDAVIKDVATGRFLDWHKVHHVDAEGARFTVKGPLITPRPPQGQVVVLAADTLGLGGRADVALVRRPERDAVAAAAAAARDAGAALVFAEVEVLLDADLPAAERLARLDGAAPWQPAGRLRHVGSPAALAALLAGLARHVDGVRLHPAQLGTDLPVLTGQVLPALAAEGLHRPPRPGATLRDTLGLPRPANRFALAATTST